MQNDSDPFSSNFSASSVSVLSPFKAATATFALNAAVWFLLGLLIAAPFTGDCVAHQSRVFTYLPALISGATSVEQGVIKRLGRSQSKGLLRRSGGKGLKTLVLHRALQNLSIG